MNILPRILFACLLFASLTASGHAHADELKFKPSRPPLRGCVWEPFENQELGIKLLVQNCSDPKAHYEFSATDDGWLEMHRPSDDQVFGGPRVLQVLHKSAEQDIQEAIYEKFVSTLNESGQAGCKVVPLQRKLKHTYMAYEIRPMGAYAEEVHKRLAKEPGDFGCGDHGKQQETVYFEYHPEESRTRFLFVVYGWDKDSLFDEQSITFLPEK